ncbi:DNA repair protein RAD5 [Spathaspora sp. JA1]|nr:DNA repair protein RAD5 [Spathaspora sp. JA1]
MAYEKSIFQRSIEITNDLTKLVPIGTLNFYGLPLDKSDLGGLTPENDPDSLWKWFDIDFFVYICQGKVCQTLNYLQFLIDFQFVKATFRIISSDHTAERICKVRLYGVPLDVEGGRYIQEWRSLKPKSLNIDKNYQRYLQYILCFIDFSKRGWNLTDEKVIPLADLLPLVLLHCRDGSSVLRLISNQQRPNVNSSASQKSSENLQNGNGFSELTGNPAIKKKELSIEEFNFHVHRWTTNSGVMPYKQPTATTSTPFSKRIRDIYNSIPSPKVHHQKLRLSITGVKSTLYPFQARSVANMLEKETVSARALVPNLILVKSPENYRDYYFDLKSKFILASPEFLSLPRGGILAENMGLGKTLICLSLISASKYEVSKIPSDLLIHEQTQQLASEPPVNTPVKTLVEMCSNTIGENSIPWKRHVDKLPQTVISTLTKNPGYFHIQLDNDSFVSRYSQPKRHSLRKVEVFNYRKLYLCNTSLVIVPDNLFIQWNQEINKHLQPGYLKILLISNYYKNKHPDAFNIYSHTIPSDPASILQYDLILLSRTIFGKSVDNENNPLVHIYWKRLIIDEGHSMNSKTSKAASYLSRSLFAERKWAVTGTPTSGLTRLYMDELEEHQARKTKYVVKNSFDEKTDLQKLGIIIGNFLKLEPFSSQPKLWNSQIIQPLLTNSFGSELLFSNLLHSIMVRHNPRDVERDLELPPLHHDAVFLQPSYHNIMSINLFTAVLAVNAVTSERTDVDYMFHPSNRQQLRKLITNLQRATFYWTGFKQEDVETLIKICLSSLKKAETSPYSSRDIELLEKSMRFAQLALRNLQWRTSSLLHEMNYYVSNLPDIFMRTYGVGVASKAGVYGAPQLGSIQDFFFKNRFIDYGNVDRITELLEVKSREFWKKYWQENDKRNAERFNKQDSNQDFESRIKDGAIEKSMNVPDIALSTPKKSKPKKETTSPKEVLEQEVGQLNYSNHYEELSYDEIRQAKVLGTSSAKLSYLVSRLLEHQETKIKSLVFFEFEDSAYYLTEALDILGINYILYATSITPAQRAKNLVEFSNYQDNEGICLIMDLRLAAHGLTILSATRVYFISPVWSQSIEAQAIKRAHRIGQTKDVFVETLILKGTLEEEIYKRRATDVKQEQLGPDGEEVVNEEEQDKRDKRRYVIDDTGMQEYVSKYAFLEIQDSDLDEYAPFQHSDVDMGSIKQEVPSEYSLLKHQSFINSGSRTWDMYLFSQASLDKTNRLQNERAQKSALQNIATNPDNSKKRTQLETIPTTRKRVHFDST